MNLSFLDISIPIIYLMGILLVSLMLAWCFRQQQSARQYFLADKSLPWWMVGMSVIAVNISAEHFVAMQHSAFLTGLLLISFEWMAAVTLILIAKFWLPVCVNRGIYTLPQLVQHRVGRQARKFIAAYWLSFNVLVVLTGLFWLSAETLHQLTGVSPSWIIVCLVLMASVPVLTSGMAVIARLDVVHLITIGIIGLLVVLLLLQQTGEFLQTGSSLATLQNIFQQYPEQFDLLVEPEQPFYQQMPGTSVWLGGLWIVNLHYWGLNQNILQRMVSGRSLVECQKGLLLAAGIKLCLPIIVILPGILLMVLMGGEQVQSSSVQIFKLLPEGFKGLSIVLLLAATLSSLSSVALSTSALFSVDLQQNESPNQNTLWLAKLVAFGALLIAALIAYPLFSGGSNSMVYLQMLGSILTPAILVIFVTMFMFKKTTSIVFFLPVITSLFSSFVLNHFYPSLAFLHQLEVTFLVALSSNILVRFISKDKQCLEFETSFSVSETSLGFKLVSAVFLLIIICMYAVFS